MSKHRRKFANGHAKSRRRNAGDGFGFDVMSDEDLLRAHQVAVQAIRRETWDAETLKALQEEMERRKIIGTGA